MAELDFDTIYSTNGTIIQHRYAKKRADNGSSVIALKNSIGAVIVASKPRTSKLHVQESDLRIRKISGNSFMSYSGILTDGFLLYTLVKNACQDYRKSYGMEASAEYLRKIIFDYLYIFTSRMSLRAIGANFLTVVKENNSFQIFLGEPNAEVSKWKACAVGTGSRRAFTELEKLDLEALNISEMLDNAIRILYRCHDPINDPEFDVEAVYVSHDTDFIRVDPSEVANIADKYKDISIDDSE